MVPSIAIATPSTRPSPPARAFTPCVRLFADRVVVTRTDGLSCDVDEPLVPLVTLGFDYGDSAERDVRGEHDARRILERLGALEIACVDSIAAPEECEAEYVVRADGDEQAFCSFTARALACWRALGWRVAL